MCKMLNCKQLSHDKLKCGCYKQVTVSSYMFNH